MSTARERLRAWAHGSVRGMTFSETTRPDCAAVWALAVVDELAAAERARDEARAEAVELARFLEEAMHDIEFDDFPDVGGPWWTRAKKAVCKALDPVPSPGSEDGAK